MNHSSQQSRKNLAAGTSISRLLLVIFLAGLVVSSFVVYSVFLTYRVNAVGDMAKADGRRISHLVFEHFYSVMRKGATRGEIDDLVHHIQNQLPDYEVTIVRGEPVVRQFGDRPGQDELRGGDKLLSQVLISGEEYSGTSGANLRYLFPIKVTGECAGCHTKAKIGEVNGVIAVSVPLAALEAPIAAFAHPIMGLALGLVMVLLVVIFLVLRRRVSVPIEELADHVSLIYQVADYSRDLALAESWPREVQGLAANFNGLMGQVRASHDQLREFSLRDPLTGLFNRRHFDAAIEQAVTDSLTGGPVFAVLLIDLDHFKPVNDEYGHAAGDAMLVSVGSALMNTVRATDLVARIGGDEFAVLALATNYDEAKELAERLQHAVAATAMRMGHELIYASCSIGVAALPENGRRASDLMRAADVAMYADKLSRRDGNRQSNRD